MSANQLYLSLAACVFLLQGCALSTVRPTINAPGSSGDASVHRYSVEWLTDDRRPEHPKAKDHVFVGIAVSGGGTRASNFGLAVLRELEEMGLLEHATVISSVSGGSLANAYYALDGEPSDGAWKSDDEQAFIASRTDFWERTKRLFAQDFRTSLIKKYLRPDNLLATLTTPITRTDLLSDTLDEKVFQGRTFSELDSPRREPCTGENVLECYALPGPFKPRVRINATITNRLPSDLDSQIPSRRLVVPAALGQPFSFTDIGFQSLRSDIRSVRIADAVAASAAFPGLLSDVSLAAYDDGGSVRGYVKLLDGGPSDNLGTEAVVDSLTKWWGRPRKSGCLLIVVDAFAGNTDDPSVFFKRDSRSWYDRIVDTNFIAALDSLLVRRRELALEAIGVPISVAFQGAEIRDPVTGLPRRVRAKSPPFNPSVAMQSWYSPTEPAPKCAVWRLSLDDVEQKLLALSNDRGILNEMELRRVSEQLWNVSAVSWLASSTKTDFDLVGAPGCSAEVLQDALWDAAKALVHDDEKTRGQVCRWMSEHGITPRKACTAPAVRADRHKSYFVRPSSTNPAGGVECKSGQ
jgi:predicted acylesterase/phospholipase RssA